MNIQLEGTNKQSHVSGMHFSKSYLLLWLFKPLCQSFLRIKLSDSMHIYNFWDWHMNCSLWEHFILEEEDRGCSSFLAVLIGNFASTHNYADRIIFRHNVIPLHRKWMMHIQWWNVVRTLHSVTCDPWVRLLDEAVWSLQLHQDRCVSNLLKGRFLTAAR